MPKKFKIAEIEPSKLSLKISEYLTGRPSEDSLKEILAKYDFSQQQLQNAIDLSLGDSVTQFSSALFRNTVGDEALAEKSLELAKNAGYNLLGIIMRYLETNELAIYLRVLLITNENDFKTLFNDLSNNTTSSDKIYKDRVEGKYEYGTPYMTHNDVKKKFYISSIFDSTKIMQPRETQTQELNKLPSTFLEFFYKNDIDYNHIRYYLDKSRTFKETKEGVDTANSIYKKNGLNMDYTYVLEAVTEHNPTEAQVEMANSIYKKNGLKSGAGYADVLEAVAKHNPTEAQVEMANSIYKENGLKSGIYYANVLEAVTKHNPTEAQVEMANSLYKENGFTSGFEYADVLEAVAKHNPTEAQVEMANSLYKENGFTSGVEYASALKAVTKHNPTEAQVEMANSLYKENGFTSGFYYANALEAVTKHNPTEAQVEMANSIYKENGFARGLDYANVLEAVTKHNPTEAQVEMANSLYKENGLKSGPAYANALKAVTKHNPTEAQVEMVNSLCKENGLKSGFAYANALKAVTKHNPTEAQVEMVNPIDKKNGFASAFDYASALKAVTKHNPTEAQAKMVNSIYKENGFASGQSYADVLNAVLKHNPTEAQVEMANSIYKENGFAWGHDYAYVLEAVTEHNPTEAQAKMVNSIYKENGLKSSVDYASALKAVTKHNPTEAQVEMVNPIYKKNGFASAFDYANALNAVLKHNPTEAQVESMILYNQAINKQVDKKAHAIEEFCKDAANIGSTHNSDNYFTQMPTSDEMMNYYLTYHLIKDRFGGDFCSMLDGFAEGSKKSCLEARDNMDMAMTLGLSVLFPDQSYYFAYPIVLSVMHNGIARLPDYINDIIPDNEILKHSANIVLSCGVSFAFSPHPTLSCGAFLTHYAQKAVSDHALDITEIDVIKHDVKYAFKYSFLAYGCVTIAKVSWENKTLPEYKKVLPFFLAYDVTIMLFDMAIDTAVVFPDILSAVYNSSVSNITNVIVELDVEVSQLVNWVANQFETPA